MLYVSAVWLVSLRGWTTTILWLMLFLCCICALIAVVLGLFLKHSFLWWCASGLTVLAIVLSICLAVLDKLGFQ